jgi:hypothetical protein
MCRRSAIMASAICHRRSGALKMGKGKGKGRKGKREERNREQGRGGMRQRQRRRQHRRRQGLPHTQAKPTAPGSGPSTSTSGGTSGAFRRLAPARPDQRRGPTLRPARPANQGPRCPRQGGTGEGRRKSGREERTSGRAAAAAAAAAKVWEGLFKPYWPSHTPPTRDRRRRYRLDTTRRQDRSARQRRRPSGGSFPITCFCRETFTHSEEKGEKGKGGREKGRKGEREEGTMGKGRAEKRTGKSGKGGQ